MTKMIVLTCVLFSSYAGFAASAAAEMRMWVAVDGLKRYTCPSEDCGVTGRFFFGESLLVHETREGWSRVTHFRSAGCYEGKSAYVESGPDDCSAKNGIVQGEYAEWVRSKFLATERLDGPRPVQGTGA